MVKARAGRARETIIEVNDSICMNPFVHLLQGEKNMTCALPIIRRLAALALLAAPAIAFGDEKPKDPRKDNSGFRFVADDAKSAASDARLAELEKKLQALLKEVQSLRSAPAEAKPAEARNVLRARVAEAAQKADPKAVRLWLESKDGKKIVVAEEKKKPEVAAKPEKDRIIIIEGATGEKKVIDVEDLKKLKDDVKAKVVKEVIVNVADAKKKAEDLTSKVVKDVIVNVADAKKMTEEMRAKLLAETLKGHLAEAKPAPEVKHTITRTTTRSTSDSSETISLSRTTYALPAAKAAALASFLKEMTQVKVLEAKVDGDKLTITTTPDVQHTIGQIVGLMTGKTAATYRLNFTPKAPEQAKQ